MGYERAVLDGAPACIKRPGALAENEKWVKKLDGAGGMMPLSVITREEWLNELTENMISWAKDKLVTEDMDGYRTGDTPERK